MMIKVSMRLFAMCHLKVQLCYLTTDVTHPDSVPESEQWLSPSTGEANRPGLEHQALME